MAAVLAATAKLEYRPLRDLRLAVPRALDDVLSMALSRSPDARFASVAAFRRALIPIFASLPKSEAHAIRFADVYAPNHSWEQLETLRARAREMREGPHDEPTIFASYSISDSMVERIEPVDTIPMVEMPQADPPPLPTKTVPMQPSPLPRRSRLPWASISFLIGAVIILGGGLFLGIQLGRIGPGPVRARPEQVVIPPPVRVSARPSAAERAVEGAVEPSIEPEAIEPVRELEAKPMRKPKRPEPRVVVESPAPPAPPAPPDLDSLVRRATVLQERAPQLRVEIDAILGDLALEGRRKDPARLQQLASRLEALETRAK
jgi:hypothetical protein